KSGNAIDQRRRLAIARHAWRNHVAWCDSPKKKRRRCSLASPPSLRMWSTQTPLFRQGCLGILPCCFGSDHPLATSSISAINLQNFTPFRTSPRPSKFVNLLRIKSIGRILTKWATNHFDARLSGEKQPQPRLILDSFCAFRLHFVFAWGRENEKM